ncbi:MAG: exopolysaccharide biosynthesis protein [Pseudomonadota bacterium]|uniref:exopolysaccharide biosynthesis protein n=1 Tax=unclassified Phenylobacterium TaxID=2640670 RepID=UPI0007006679|nr:MULTISPECIES: exopolysaccharide biosynthesis protein [unclassified Phenylobacterium]KRB51095.1 hypothetical protein ASE02_14680 [Phenylobacterium sp. Root700]MBT9471581.1 exopolysaccharide biosynthesis protein [Phenylobacterium sp.]
MSDSWAEEQQKPISAVLRELGAEDSMRLGDIVDRFGRRAFGSLLFVFAIPNLLPLPPGSSTVLGAPLLLLTPQVALGAHAPWLPRWLDDREISGADINRVFNRLLPWVERIEKISRPRLGFMFGTVGDRAIGVVCALLSFVLILPIPLGNLLPALTIGVLGFSLFQRDGLFAVAGYVLAAFSTLLLYLAADAVIAGVRLLVNWLGGA